MLDLFSTAKVAFRSANRKDLDKGPLGFAGSAFGRTTQTGHSWLHDVTILHYAYWQATGDHDTLVGPAARSACTTLTPAILSSIMAWPSEASASCTTAVSKW